MDQFKINAQNILLRDFGLGKIKSTVYPTNNYQPSYSITNEQARKVVDLGLNEIYKPGVGVVVSEQEINKSSVTPLYNNPVISKFGTLVFSELLFKEAKDLNGTIIKWDFESIHTCLFTVNQSKNIIKTAIQGKNGTIKEYISNGDYSINIKGIITGFNGQYPTDKVNNLFKFLDLNRELDIISPYLNDLFQIRQIVVDTFDFPQNEGGISYQTFEINALSDNMNDPYQGSLNEYINLFKT